MGNADYAKLGTWNARCFQCGRKYKADELIKHWQGMMWCPQCWEPRHPQDFVRGGRLEKAPDWIQPQGTPVFTQICTPNGRSAIAGFASAGCAIAGYIDALFDPTISPA